MRTHYTIIGTHYYKINIIIIVTGMYIYIYVTYMRAGYCSWMSQGATGLYGLFFF